MYTQQAAPPINTTNVTQTVNFNEPVETAGMAARRLQKVNEELGAMMYGVIFYGLIGSLEFGSSEEYTMVDADIHDYAV